MSRLRAALIYSLLLLALAIFTAGCAVQTEAELQDGVAPVKTAELPLAPPTGEAHLPDPQPTIAALQTANALHTPPSSTRGDSPEAEEVLRRWREAIERVRTLRITQQWTEFDSRQEVYSNWDLHSVEEVFSVVEPEKAHYRVKVTLAHGDFTIVYNDQGAYLKASWHPEVIRPWPDVHEDAYWTEIGDYSGFQMLRPQVSLYSLVEHKEVDGRKVTELVVKVGNSGQAGTGGTRILLDEATWLPYCITWYGPAADGGTEPTREVTFTRLEVNPPLNEGELALELPDPQASVTVYAPPHWGNPLPTYATVADAQREAGFTLFEPASGISGVVETLAYVEIAGTKQPLFSMNNRAIMESTYLPTFDFASTLSTANWGGATASVVPTEISVDGRAAQSYDEGFRVRLRFERHGTQIQVVAQTKDEAIELARSLRLVGGE
jgi:hypothetical protein